MLRTLVASLYFFLRRGQSVEVWLMTRTGQAGPCVHIRIQASNRHGSDHATGTIELALIRKAGTQENLEVDRLVPSRWQRTQLNALGTTRSTFLSSWLPDSKSLQRGSER